MKILSLRHAAYWLAPKHLPEAVRRSARAVGGHTWANARAHDSDISFDLRLHHQEELAAARARVDSAGVRMGGAGNLDVIYDLCEQTHATRVIETGVAYGWSSLAILLSIAPRGGQLWSTDLSYDFQDSTSAVGIAVPDKFHSHWTLLQGPDTDQVPEAITQAGTIDFAHYDSAKTPTALLVTGTRLFDALRPGGVLMIDDIGDHLGARDLTHEIGVDVEVIRHDGKFQAILTKPEK